ncbi:hypothetical protein TNCV_3073721 [Trichonephila clavipes]|nr:hypothetical protein TNCV_3073721 [Trichonephila clavipes]
MFDSSSFVNPTPLAHADTSRGVLPRGGTSQYLRQTSRKKYGYCSLVVKPRGKLGYRGHHKLVAGVVESRVRVLMPMKTPRVEKIMHVKSLEAQKPPVVAM